MDGLIARPKFQLRSLPIPIRWEVTRRHPYYQIFWPLARDFFENRPLSENGDLLLRLGAVASLMQIGVSGAPYDPATSFKELGEEQLQTAWLSGAIHPVSLRGLAGILLTALPKETLADLARLFNLAAQDDDEMPSQFFSLTAELMNLDRPGLNSYPDEPFVSINPAASERQIITSLNSHLKRWKLERGLKQRRDRSEKFKAYFRVWDLREGWAGGHYDRIAERTLKDVAKQIKQPVSTVSKRYRRAFELIVGEPYTPALWVQAFGVLKLTGLTGVAVSRVAQRRPQKSPTRRPAPESRLASDAGPRAKATPVNSAVSQSNETLTDLFIDIRELAKQGKTDEEIATALELPHNLLDEISTIRRMTEMP